MRNTFPSFRPCLHLCCGLFILLCCSATTFTFGQTVFSLKEIIDYPISPYPNTTIFDIDNDGDNDIILPILSTTMWYENDSNGNFSSSNTLEETNGTSSIFRFISDMDQDGDGDIVKIRPSQGQVYVRNNDGNGNFSVSQLAVIIGNQLSYITMNDIDNDGDDDLLYAYNENNIAWRANNGDGTFGEEHFVATIYGTPFIIDITDVNNDGSKDIVTFLEDAGLIIGDGGAMNWYANDGNGNFADAQTATYTNSFPTQTIVVDMDNDGDYDVAALIDSSIGIPEKQLIWYENQGNGHFSNEIVMTNLYGTIVDLAISDLDKDGDMDIAYAIITSSNPYTPNAPGISILSWCENTGNNETFITHAIYSSEPLYIQSMPYPFMVSLADFDNDQDIDILYYDYSTNELRWYENLLNTPTQPAPPAAAFTTTPTPQSTDTLRLCEGQSVSFLNQSQNANAYLWNFGDGTATTTQINPQHNFQQAGTYTASLVAAQNTPLAFECEAEAGELVQLFDQFHHYTANYNDNPNYSQAYLYFDDEGNLIGTVITGGSLYPEVGATSVAAINYPTATTLNINTLNELNNFVNNTDCVDVDVYDACEVHSIQVNPYYSAEYGGYVIIVTIDYGWTIPPPHIESNSANENIGLLALYGDTGYYTFILGNEAGTVFSPGDTATICPFINEETLLYSAGSCCKTFIFPDTIPGGGNQQNRLQQAPIPQPLYSYSSADRSSESTTELSDTATMVIIVEEGTAPDIQCVSTLCANDTTTYFSSTICDSYEWTVTGGNIINGQGSNSITVVWQDEPQGTISLLANCGENTCDFPTTLAVPILTPTATITGNVNVCVGATENYAAPYFNGAIYQWSIVPPSGGSIIGDPNGHQITVQWNTQNALLTVNYRNELLPCEGTATLAINPNPTFALDTPDPLCVGNAVPLSLSNGMAATWTANGGTITAGQGTDEVTVLWEQSTNTSLTATLIDTTIFCNTTASVNVPVLPLPTAPTISGSITVCPSDNYTYTASPYQSNTTLTWSVLNGTIISGQNTNSIEVDWNENTPHQVNVVRQTNSEPVCVSDTAQLMVANLADILDLAIAGNNMVCENSSQHYFFYYYDNSFDYVWSITPSNAGQIVGGQGTPQINVLWAWNSNITNAQIHLDICGQTWTYNVAIGSPSSVSIAQNGILCSNNSVSLSAQSSVPLSAWVWSDTSNAVLSNAPILTVTNKGIYNLHVTDVYGCSADATHWVAKNTSPIAQILGYPPSICLEYPYNVNMAAMDGTNYSFQWLQGGIPIGGINAPFLTHNTSTIEGVFNYSVRVTDTATGCVSLSDGFPIAQISCPPDTTGGGGNPTGGGDNNPCPLEGSSQLNFSLIDSPNCQTISLQNNSTDPFTNLSVYWGDNTNENIQNTTINHFYPDEVNTYNIWLYGYYTHSVTNNLCYTLQNFQHSVPMYARFDVATACLGEAWTFADRSFHVPTTNITNWTWNFGDGTDSISGTDSLTHTYTQAGFYPVTLTVSNGECSDTRTQFVQVQALPQLEISLNGSPCQNNVLQFLPSENSYTNYLWNFGDGSTSSLLSPLHSYADVGDYTISASAVSEQGCLVQSPELVLGIHPTPIPENIIVADSTICEGTSTLLTAPLGESYLWNNGSTDNSISVNTTGNYSVQVTREDGCSYLSSNAHITVAPQPNATLNVDDTTMVCYDENGYVLSVADNPNYSYQWSYYNTDTPTRTVYYANTYSITVTDTQSNCSATDQATVQIIYPPFGLNVSVDDPTICVGEMSTIAAFADGYTEEINYLWSNGATTPNIQVSTSGEYTFVAIDEYGCVSDTSESVTVYINELPNVSLFPSGCYETCQGDTIWLSNDTTITYQWFLNGDTLPQTTPYLVANMAGDYQVLMSNANACSEQSDILHLTLNGVCPTEVSLPIQLIDFSGTVQTQGNLLQWISATETNCDHYTLYYSPDGNTFVPITEQKAAGNSNISQKYTYFHPNKAPMAYYHLSYTDKDGSEHIASTIVLYRTHKPINTLLVYPNPTQNTLQIRYESATNVPTVLQVYDITGRLLQQQTESTQIGINQWQVSLQNYPIGIYWLRVGEQYLKVIKQ